MSCRALLILYFYVSGVYFVEPIKKWGVRRGNTRMLTTENEELKKLTESLYAENIRLQSTLACIQETEDITDFQKKYKQSGSIASIILRCLSGQENYFLIDKGSWHAITKDMAAVYKNCLIGRVIEVFPWYSKVQLITDALSKIAAHCPQDGLKGIHQGTNHADRMLLTYVSHFKTVSPGALLLSSGEGLVFPAGFGLGIISTHTAQELYYEIEVKPLIDFRTLDYCVILHKSSCT